MMSFVEEWSAETTYFEDDVVRYQGVEEIIHVDYFVGVPPTLENQIALLKQELQNVRARENILTEGWLSLQKS